MLRNKKGFSLIELVVTIAIVGILVLLASPRFLGRTKEATLAKHLHNVKILEDTMDRYVLENDRFPRLSEEAYTSQQVEEYANRIRDLTGEEITLDPEGKYYDIDYVTLRDYVKVPDKNDRPNYILQNPAGKVFYLEYLKPEAEKRADFTVSNPVAGQSSSSQVNKMPQAEIDEWVVKGYIPVSTAKELQDIKNNLSDKYIQVADINLSNIKNFEPIGTSWKEPFEGVYNGAGFEINKLTISRMDADYNGLFGYTVGATLENIGLVNVSIEGGNNTGALAGYSMSNSRITNSYSTGVVSGTGYYTGGLVGNNMNNSSVSNSYFTGRVIGENNVGGLVGGGANGSRINNCYSAGEVDGKGERVGGLMGSSTGDITNSYSTGTVKGTNRYVGSLVGWNHGWVRYSYSTGKTTGSSSVGGLIGYNNSGSSADSYYDTATTGLANSDGGAKGLTTTKMQERSSYSGWNFNTIWQISPNEYPTFQWQN